ncbi:GNAT family N-acetyltransferase [Helicobacter monodelphidis]
MSFNKKYWHNGYAIESAIACKKYSFEELKVNKVYSIMRDNNMSSQNVVKRNGIKKLYKL